MIGPLLCAVALMLVAFSAPGRDGPSDVGGLDVIALVKLGVRGLTLLVVGYTILGAPPHRRNVVLSCLAIFLVYVAWAFLSVGWSALKSVSLGQAIGLLVMVLLTAAIAVQWRTVEDTSLVLFVLSLGLLGVAGIVLAVDVLDHDLSGLNREHDIEEGSIGIIHPTSAGSTAALGLLILIGSRTLWGWPWTRVMLVPGIAMHSILLLRANSRTATLLVLAALVLLLARWAPRLVAGGVLAGCIVGTLWLLIDPTLRLYDDTVNTTTGYVTRGESTQLLLSLTGRTDLWDAMWLSYQQSPWLGHGYFVTSRTGLIDVWSGPANRTAHNLFLQVLVTTGLIGLLTFLAAWVRMLYSLVIGLSRNPQARMLGGFLLLIGLWYLAWGQLCESFMGPIQPESVVFFVLLGLGLASTPEATP